MAEPGAGAAGPPLPPGYALDASDPDLHFLLRADGTTAATFSAAGPPSAARGPGTDAEVRAGRVRDRAQDRRDARRVSTGDVAAFSRLVGTHSGLVDRVALRVLGPNGAPDAGQEVWIKAWRGMGGFRGNSAFSTWLYRIAMNTCLSIRRKESRRGERHHDGEEAHLLAERAGGDADPEAEALSSERREEMRAALGCVRTDHRAALVLRHLEGLSYAEIAKVLDVPDGTAKGWVSRGRDAMLVALAGGTPPSRGPPGVKP